MTADNVSGDLDTAGGTYGLDEEPDELPQCPTCEGWSWDCKTCDGDGVVFPWQL